MVKVGITGNIGSGKSTICKVFETLGVPVLYADIVAKQLMREDKIVIELLNNSFENLYLNGVLQSDKLQEVWFYSANNREVIANIVHPAVINYSSNWFAAQTCAYAVKESALFFETGSAANIDIMIGVYTPKNIGVQRALQRSGIKLDLIKLIQENQIDVDIKMALCDMVLNNDNSSLILPELINFHNKLMIL